MEIRKYFKIVENKDTTYQNLWDADREVAGRRFIAVNVYIKKDVYICSAKNTVMKEMNEENEMTRHRLEENDLHIKTLGKQ